jgi:histidyl-tRNA synthetase
MEIVQMMAEVMSELGIAGFKIRMNHRKILGSMAKSDGLQNQENLFAVIIDKMDKIGWDGVSKELLKIGFTPDSLSKFKQIFSGELDKEDLRKKLSPMLDKDGANGLDDIFTVFEMLKKSRGNPDEQDFKWHLQFDPSLARGLSYYTGIIFEVEIEGVTVGSVSGGGRYDDLTGIFGLPDVAATGFSFGIDRLYDALEELKVFPDFAIEGHNILIVHFDEETFNYGLEVLWRLRKNQKLNTRGVSIEMYPDQSRLTKQMAYANRNPIRFTIIIGSEEMKSGKLTLKDMITGDQQSLSEDEIIDYLSQKRV